MARDPILSDFEQVQAQRSNWESLWQEISNLVLPRNDFVTKKSRGEDRHDRIFDSTAMQSNGQLAAGLESFLVNPRTKWFELRIPGTESNTNVAVWLAAVRDKMLQHFAKPESNFYSAVHESFLELGSYGTMIQFMEEGEKGPRFVSRPLPEIFLKEAHNGKIDTVYRKFSMTARQAVQFYGEDALPDRVANKNRKAPNTEFDFLQAVLPRDDFEPDKPATQNNKQWKSVHFLLSGGEKIRESGFDEFPFIVARWNKVTGEVYGRSPTMEVLPDIRMLQEMSKTVLQAAQKIVHPPMLAPDDGVIGPVRTTPGGLNYYRAGAATGTGNRPPIEPLQTGGRVDIGSDLIAQRQATVQRSYMISEILGLISRGDSSPLKAAEVAGRQQQALRQLAPILARLEKEFLNPAIDRTFAMMLRKEEFPEPPEEIAGQDVSVEFVSQAAIAQQASENENTLNWLQQILPIFQVDPQAANNIDTDEFVRKTAEANNIPPEILVDRAVVEQQRAQAAQQSRGDILTQQLQQSGQAVGTLSEAAATLQEVSSGGRSG